MGKEGKGKEKVDVDGKERKRRGLKREGSWQIRKNQLDSSARQKRKNVTKIVMLTVTKGTREEGQNLNEALPFVFSRERKNKGIVWMCDRLNLVVCMFFAFFSFLY